MIPYPASDVDEPTQIVPWTNYSIIALNFLVFFYALSVNAQGDAPFTQFARSSSTDGAYGSPRPMIQTPLRSSTPARP